MKITRVNFNLFTLKNASSQVIQLEKEINKTKNNSVFNLNFSVHATIRKNSKKENLTV